MQTQSHKYWLYIIVVLVLVGLGFGGYYAYKNYFLKSKNNILGGLPGQLFGPKGAGKAQNLDADQIIFWTNKYREDNNLKPLVKNNLLTKSAATKVQDMFAKQYFEHVSPDGVSPSQLVKSEGYDYKVTGENLALGNFKDEKDLVDAWMASPGHRANILNTDYTEIGVASGLQEYQDRGVTWLSVQEFGKPLPNCPKPDQSEINAKKSEYDGLVRQIDDLKAQIDALKKQKASNEETNQKISEYNTLIAQSQDLQKELQTLTNSYNAEVSVYNTCITH